MFNEHLCSYMKTCNIKRKLYIFKREIYAIRQNKLTEGAVWIEKQDVRKKRMFDKFKCEKVWLGSFETFKNL